ncbi:unnamed protein product [Rotaria sp. Silwood2]|nr:unnamed protein product [Rotaria sp. Silwood2]CAF3334052.1 unnamed protein product [Rotaria sp. Silwood2]CAF4401401.1 unnamed protein product [Rotaria sp. Silwood2]CAF4414139.1 unnamed protein product [Rotaria sp. Silwood2]
MAPRDSIKKLLVNDMRLSGDDNEPERRFVSSETDLDVIEWIDAYPNAHRIAYENHKDMERWLTKISFVKLLEELDHGYIDKIEFSTNENRITIKSYIEKAIVEQTALPLVTAYTEATSFFSHINRDLAKLGSDFRFESTRALLQLGYRDDEPPKGMGPHIFAAILIYHPSLQPYYHIGKTYRGMSITTNDLECYVIGKIFMTRSFLSTTKNREVADIFLNVSHRESNRPVICIYNTRNPHSSLYIARLSKFQDEEEVLILPFVIFRVNAIRQVITDDNSNVTEIELEEMSSMLTNIF